MLKINENNISQLIEDGERLDERELDEFRELEIVPDYIHETADGSALVKIGDTKVIVGISTELDSPYPDRPNSGMLITNVELTSMAAPRYESGPPGDEAIEIARVVDRGIRESKVMDLEDLVIEEGESCWAVFVDIHVLDYDGGLIDAASIGAITALHLGTLPSLDEDGNVDRENRSGPIPVDGFPVTLTGSKIGSKLVYDTTADEEEVRQARLTATVKEDGNVVNMQKGEAGPLEQDEVVSILSTIKEKGQKITERIKAAIDEA